MPSIDQPTSEILVADALAGMESEQLVMHPSTYTFNWTAKSRAIRSRVCLCSSMR